MKVWAVINAFDVANQTEWKVKTIIARFTEIDKLTADQKELLDEDYNFNNIEKALKTVGVQSKDSTGQLRAFSDIIGDLGEKWDTLDTNT